MSIHSVKRSQSNLAWDNSIPPVLYVSSGDIVSFDCLDASNGQITSTSTTSSLKTLVYSQLDQVNGPVHVATALPGDTLRIDIILSLDPASWGWSALIPGFGLLADDFPEPALKIWSLHRGDDAHAWFQDTIATKRIRIPLKPFMGEMGVAPATPGAHSTISPYPTGGNVDTRHLTAGSTLYLPVEVEGALFSIGDGHAAQGDGEVCGTAIETPMRVTVRLIVLKDKPYVKTPQRSSTAPPASIRVRPSSIPSKRVHAPCVFVSVWYLDTLFATWCP